MGDGMLVRLRSASIALFGLVTVVGLGLIVFIAQLGFPGVFSSPIPGSSSKAGSVDDAIALVKERSFESSRRLRSHDRTTTARAPRLVRSPVDAGLGDSRQLAASPAAQPSPAVAPPPPQSPAPAATPAPATTPTPALEPTSQPATPVPVSSPPPPAPDSGTGSTPKPDPEAQETKTSTSRSKSKWGHHRPPWESHDDSSDEAKDEDQVSPPPKTIPAPVETPPKTTVPVLPEPKSKQAPAVPEKGAEKEPSDSWKSGRSRH